MSSKEDASSDNSRHQLVYQNENIDSVKRASDNLALQDDSSACIDDIESKIKEIESVKIQRTPL